MKTFRNLVCICSVFVCLGGAQNSPTHEQQDAATQSPQSVTTDVTVGAPYDWKNPEYPKDALRKKLQGSVVLRLNLDEKGHVVDARVISGDQEFSEAAIRAVRKWKYSPYVIDDAALKVTTLVKIDFRFNSSGKPQVTAGYKESAPQNVYKVGGPVSAPRVLHSQDPQYSEEARQEKYQGTCLLGVLVGPDGRAHNIRVFRPLGKGLDEKAIEAVQQWRFSPAKKDGKPVAVMINIEVQFRLY